jgi:hypothetical protein
MDPNQAAPGAQEGAAQAMPGTAPPEGDVAAEMAALEGGQVGVGNGAQAVAGPNGGVQ